MAANQPRLLELPDRAGPHRRRTASGRETEPASRVARPTANPSVEIFPSLDLRLLREHIIRTLIHARDVDHAGF